MFHLKRVLLSSINRITNFKLSLIKLRAIRQPFVLFALFLFAGTSFALFVGGDYLINFSKSVGNGYSVSANSDGSSTVQALGVESLGNTTMAGGDYIINVNGTNTVSKLSNDLSNAHCYPNPYKPNSGLGHTKITFSYVTSHIELRIFNIAGELVYNTDADTPSGELSWDVVNNSGQKLASGVYIYIITDNQGHKKMGKFAVIR